MTRVAMLERRDKSCSVLRVKESGWKAKEVEHVTVTAGGKSGAALVSGGKCDGQKNLSAHTNWGGSDDVGSYVI